MFMMIYWIILKIAVEPVEVLVSSYYLRSILVLTFADASERLARRADAHCAPYTLDGLVQRDVRSRNAVAHPFPLRDPPCHGRYILLPLICYLKGHVTVEERT